MDKISLALTGKLIELYEQTEDNDEVFISLETTPMPYTEQDFLFVDEADNDPDKIRQAKQNQMQFFEHTDQIPTLSRFWDAKISPFSKLSSAYEETMRKAIPLDNYLDASQKKEYERAENILNSDKKEKYDQFSEVYAHMQDELIDLKMELVTEENEAKIELLNEKKKLLEERLEKKEQDWVVDGFKNEIDEAKSTYTRLKNYKFSSAETDWAEAANVFKNSNENTVYADINYKPTYYRPVNFNDDSKHSSGWRRISIEGNQIEKLAQVARNSAFVDDDVHSQPDNELDIKKIQAEIIELTIRRPWFNSEMLMRDNWKFPEQSGMLSTGHTHDSDESMMPAYIMSFILARNVDIELENTRNNEQLIHKLQVRAMPLQIGPMLMDVQKPAVDSGTKAKKFSMPKKLNPVKADLYRKNMHTLKMQDQAVKRSAFRKTLKVERQVQLLNTKPGIAQKINTKEKSQPKATVYAEVKPIKMHVQPITMYTLPVDAQTKKPKFGFKGQVKGEGLAGERIEVKFIKTGNKGADKTIHTDDTGSYSVELKPGEYKVIVRHRAYNEIDKPLKNYDKNKMNQLDLYLQPNAIYAEESLEEQYEGYLLFGYKCRRMPALPNPDSAKLLMHDLNQED